MFGAGVASAQSADSSISTFSDSEIAITLAASPITLSTRTFERRFFSSITILLRLITSFIRTARSHPLAYCDPIVGFGSRFRWLHSFSTCGVGRATLRLDRRVESEQ